MMLSHFNLWSRSVIVTMSNITWQMCLIRSGPFNEMSVQYLTSSNGVHNEIEIIYIFKMGWRPRTKAIRALSQLEIAIYLITLNVLKCVHFKHYADSFLKIERGEQATEFEIEREFASGGWTKEMEMMICQFERMIWPAKALSLFRSVFLFLSLGGRIRPRKLQYCWFGLSKLSSCMKSIWFNFNVDRNSSGCYYSKCRFHLMVFPLHH